MKMMKGNLLVGGILSVMLLAGCVETGEVLQTEVNAESNIDETIKSTYPDNVKNGTVSEETYAEVVRYFKEYPDFMNRLNVFTGKINIDGNIIKDELFASEFKTFLDEYDVFMKGFYLNPKTDADFEINGIYYDISSSILASNSQVKQLLKTKDSIHAGLASDYSNEAVTSINALANTMTKYDLIK